MNNAAIIAYCNAEIPDIIYLSIGCAQESYSLQKPPQQYPPCIAALGGRQICILVDPRLEPTEAPILHDKNVSFITVRRYFEWRSEDDRRFIDDLCRLATTQKTRLLAQDYTGYDIYPEFPIERFDRDVLCRKVLFDFTYNEGGCYIDLSKVRILLRADGSFLQPTFEPLVTVPFECLAVTIQQRHMNMWSYVKRLHRIQTGAEEARDWCTPATVLERMTPLCKAYRVARGTDNETLEKLMLLYLSDLCACAGESMTEEEALRIVRGSGYREAIDLLKNVLLQ